MFRQAGNETDNDRAKQIDQQCGDRKGPGNGIKLNRYRQIAPSAPPAPTAKQVCISVPP